MHAPGGTVAEYERIMAQPPSAPLENLIALVAERSGLDPAEVAAAIGDGPVTSDAELVAVARAVASVHQEVLR